MERTEYQRLRPRYAQLAVAIGGAARDLPEDGGALEGGISRPPDGPRKLERFQTKGL